MKFDIESTFGSKFDKENSILIIIRFLIIFFIEIRHRISLGSKFEFWLKFDIESMMCQIRQE